MSAPAVNSVTLVGRLTGRPEPASPARRPSRLRSAPRGRRRAGQAAVHRRRDVRPRRRGVCEAPDQGPQVAVVGRLAYREWEDKEGRRRSKHSVIGRVLFGSGGDQVAPGEAGAMTRPSTNAAGEIRPPLRPLDGPLLRPEQAAELLAVKTSWVYEAVRTGRLPCLRVGRHIRFTRGMLEDWLGGRSPPSGGNQVPAGVPLVDARRATCATPPAYASFPPWRSTVGAGIQSRARIVLRGRVRSRRGDDARRAHVHDRRRWDSGR